MPIAPVPTALRVRVDLVVIVPVPVLLVPFVALSVLCNGGRGGRYHHRHYNDYRKEQAEASHIDATSFRR